jgi:hypothetical protein
LPKCVGRILTVGEFVLKGPVDISTSNGKHAAQDRVLAGRAEAERTNLVHQASKIAWVTSAEGGVKRSEDLGRRHATSSAIYAMEDLPKHSLIVRANDG